MDSQRLRPNSHIKQAPSPRNRHPGPDPGSICSSNISARHTQAAGPGTILEPRKTIPPRESVPFCGGFAGSWVYLLRHAASTSLYAHPKHPCFVRSKEVHPAPCELCESERSGSNPLHSSRYIKFVLSFDSNHSSQTMTKGTTIPPTCCPE